MAKAYEGGRVFGDEFSSRIHGRPGIVSRAPAAVPCCPQRRERAPSPAGLSGAAAGAGFASEADAQAGVAIVMLRPVVCLNSGGNRRSTGTYGQRCPGYRLETRAMRWWNCRASISGLLDKRSDVNARTDTDMNLIELIRTGSSPLNSIWRFYSDAAHHWRWQRLAFDGTVVDHSKSAYAQYEACLANASEHGYVFIPPLTTKGTSMSSKVQRSCTPLTAGHQQFVSEIATEALDQRECISIDDALGSD